MSMIFPGMDPYLENPLVWHGVHSSFVVYMADHLQPLLHPRYIAAVEGRVFVEGPNREIIPDVWITRSQQPAPSPRQGVVAEADTPMVLQVGTLEIHESFIEILDRQSGMSVVAVIELVSPTSKFPGPGRESCHAIVASEVIGVAASLPFPA